MASSEVDTQDLSRREREAMDIVYRLGRATALEIRAQMAQPPTDAAVRTTLRILVRKGRLKQEYDGPRFVYFPTLAREAARRSAFRHLLDRKCRVVFTCLWTGGSGLVDETIETVANEARAHGQSVVYGRDYVDLGYKAGYEAVMVLMGKGIVNAFPQDQRANQTASLPLMREVRDYSSFALLVNISAGYPGTKEWVQQVNSRFHLPMVSGCTAVSAPEYFPYLQSGQLRGLLGGMAGAAEYEKLQGEKGQATRGMDAQSLAHVFVALCIVMGNLVQWSKTRRGA